MCFSFSKVYAEDSNFGVTRITRENLREIAANDSLQSDENIVPVTLGISESGYKTNNGETYWTVKDPNGVYNDLYCVNVSRGFGAPNGPITDSNSTKRYVTQFDKDNNNFGTYTGLTNTQKNKILWILNNSVMSNDISSILSAASVKVERAGWTSYVQQDMINNNDSRTALTFEDIKIVQQIAIWNFSNPGSAFQDTISGICDSTGRQISAQGENILVKTDTYRNTLTSGFIKQTKLNALYQYFIDGANSATDGENEIHTLELNATNNVKESEDKNYFIAGPFSVSKQNVDITGLTVNLNGIATTDYTIVDSNENNIDYKNTNTFYVKILKSNITTNTEVKVIINGTYKTKTLKFITDANDPNNTQPLVLVEEDNEPIQKNAKVNINLTQIKVTKIWDDEENQDGKRPDSVEVQLYADNAIYGDAVTLSHNNNWYYTWDKLLSGKTYTVKELKPDGTTAIANNGQYNNDYTIVTYSSGEEYVTVITNKHTPEKTEKTVTKVWDDNNNQDNKRNSYKVTLTGKVGNTTVYTDTQTLDKNTLTYTWRNLDKYKNGTEIAYTVDETQVPTGYTKKVEGFTITNKYIPETTNIEVEKKWSDSNDKDNLRPTSIKVQLYVNGNASGDEVILNESNSWKKVWSDLAVKNNGQTINYEVRELNSNNEKVEDGENYNSHYIATYDVNGSKTIITNTHTPYKADLALRKYITSINGVSIKASDNEYRVPNITNTSVLNGNDASNHTATYNHQKAPITVKEGAEIIYNITVYNEGKEVAARATQIMDQLPEGLEYDNWVSDNYTASYNNTTHRLTLTKIETNNITKYSGSGNPSSETVQVKCKVTAKSGAQRKFLTNIAWISGMMDENGNTQNDIDSRTDDINYNMNDTEGYTGKGNKSDLSDKNNYYKGQQDDDDFDKVVIEPAIPDLALRKYITKIGNTEITNRIPQISDTDKLDGDDAANHTAIYKHPKNVLEVKKGDMIEYSLTVYNEGKVPARASKITDQIPDGLKFIEVVSENYSKDFYNEESNILVLKEKSSNTDLGIFEKGKALKSTTVVVKCEVLDNAVEETNLVNIAWISEMKKGNETFTADIDSQTTTNPECDKNSHDYSRQELNNTGYFPGQQDDDDYERVIIRKIPVEDGELKLKLIKVDESENKITSSEAKFDITEANNTENKTTTSGELNLGTKTITGASFEYIYTIKETQAPTGYELVNDILTVKISGTTKVENNKYVVDTIELKDKDGNNLDTSKIKAEYDRTSNTVIIRVKDKKIENEYSVRLLKVNQDGTQALDNAWFKVSETNNMTNVQARKISVNGETLKTAKLTNTNSISLTYYLQETVAPEGYIKDETIKEVKIKADVELKDGQYKLKNVRLDPAVTGIEITTQNNVITIKVKNNPEVITGKYKVIVKKVDSTTGDVIPETKGAKFKINNTTYTLGHHEIANVDITSANDINLQYTIEETTAPTGYDRIEGTKTAKGTLKIVKDGTTWKVNRLENVQVDDNIEMAQDSSDSNTIIIKIKDNPIKKDFDLALRKFITAVNNEELKNGDVYNRAPIVDTTPLKNKTATTATYKHTKFPVSVQKGDVVTYTIRVYNEGEVDGYVNKIADYLPNYLQPILAGVSGIDTTKYAEEITFNTDRLWTLGENNRVETEITNKEKQSAVDMYGTEGLLLSKFNGGDSLDYIDVQIKCLVKDDEGLKTGTYLTNIAEIVDAEDINGEHWDGKDSALNGLKNGNPTDTSDLNNYKNTEALASTTESYIEGQEDDDDFEKLVIESFDLALRKFAIAIKSGDKEVELKDKDGKYTREPKVDTSKLGVDGVTTAIYTHPKNPIKVKKGDIVTYVLRIYNEGTLPGKATKVFDYLPQGLEFIDKTVSSINQTYGWNLEDGKLVTSYLDDDSKELKAVTTDSEGKKVLDYQDIKVQFKVTADPKTFSGKEIVNYAEIGEDSNNDIDSKPGNGHGEKESKEDDDDFEPLELGYFDLALRKFITKVNEIEYNNRVPEVDTSKLGTLDEKGKKITTFTYNHTKDPVVVETGSTVVYTIRVYNEGSISGYAYEITDNIPEGLEFLPENKINKEDYKWKMLDEQGNVTTDVTKAKKITTAYLANDIIDAYKKENGTEVISYKDVKVAFKVTEPGTSNRLVVNTAEISKASDEDIDSTPGNDDLSEDDIDREYLKVKYFDLALKKWVTATKVIYEGKTKTTKTGFNEDSTGIAKVDLVAKKLKKTTVKFVYKIKVINEGEVAGYATEVEDYIPNGLKFVQADNPKWKLTKNNIAVTDQLKDVLLQPGQSATIEIVLTWKNSASNMGVKTNWAEIKEDSGDDIDSTPDNDKKEEDDEDNAKVVLSIKTGSVPTYIVLVLTSVAILGGGTFLIKKYVVK